MRVLVIDKHASRHERLRETVEAVIEDADVRIVLGLKDLNSDIEEFQILMIHVGNSTDYSIIFRSKPIKDIIYYTGQYEVINVDKDGVWAPYEQLEKALKTLLNL